MVFNPAQRVPLPDGKLPTRLEPFHDSYPRYLFYKALEEHTPEVLEHLRDDVLPAYAALTLVKSKQSYSKVGLRPAERVGLSLDIDPGFASDLPISWWSVEQGASETQEALDLHTALTKWSSQFHLTNEWLLDLALHTLFHWREKKEEGQPVRLRWHRLPFGGMGAFDGWAPEFELTQDGWDLNDEDWPQFRKRVQNAFEKSLNDYREQTTLIALNGGWRRAPDIRDSKQRFKWLALWQVKGWSAKEILEWCQLKVNASNVEKQVKTSAEQAGVTLRRPQKGRRRAL
jgi:hypothetical protein